MITYACGHTEPNVAHRVYSALKCPKCNHPTPELFEAKETPFNLAGESEKCALCGVDLIIGHFEPGSDASICLDCQEARVRALAEAEARKTQRSLFECGGTFDGFTCGSDADPGL